MGYNREAQSIKPLGWGNTYGTINVMDNDKSKVRALGETAIKPVGWDRSGLEAFKYMLYNPETGKVLTRTPLSWLKIIVFYCIFWSCLACFWISCLHLFFQSLPDSDLGPRWKKEYSIIGSHPGVALRPRNSDKRIDSRMFVLKQGDHSIYPSHPEGEENDTNADYARRMEKFLEVYTEKARGYNDFDMLELGDCASHPFGYLETNISGILSPVAPCIFLKLNTIWDWEPVAVGSDYLNPNEKNAPLPYRLKKHIESIEAEGGDVNKIWIDCGGRYAADEEALEGLQYFPASRGFPVKYFPYQGKGKFDEATQKYEHHYHSPLVAVKISSKITWQIIHIQCKVFYENVIHNNKDKMGLVNFEVQIKKDT